MKKASEWRPYQGCVSVPTYYKYAKNFHPQIDEEQMLLTELKKIEARKRERERKTQDLQKLISRADNAPSAVVNNGDAPGAPAVATAIARRHDKKLHKKKISAQQRPARVVENVVSSNSDPPTQLCGVVKIIVFWAFVSFNYIPICGDLWRFPARSWPKIFWPLLPCNFFWHNFTITITASYQKSVTKIRVTYILSRYRTCVQWLCK